jgi:hypothetical protein
MLKPRPLKGPFGHHYLIYRNRDGAVPRSMKPLKFTSSDGARTLLRQLHVSHSYWQLLAQDLDEMAPLCGHQRDYLQVICNSLASGRLRLYGIRLPDDHLHAGNKAVIPHRHGDQYLFTPASFALTQAQRPYRFQSIVEVHQLLHDLAPNLEQLESLASTLKLAHSTQGLSYTQLIELLAEALTDETVVLYVQSSFKRCGNSGSAESSATMPGNRPVPLAPPTVASEKASGLTSTTSSNTGIDGSKGGEKVAAPTLEEIALAKSEGASREHIQARTKLSRYFLKSNGFTESQIANAIGDEGAGIEGGVDLTKPIEVMYFPPPEQMTQYVKSHGFPGNWFDPQGNQTPDALGLSGEGRTLKPFNMPSSQGLLSYSKPIVDNWTNPGVSVSTAGGGKQLLVNDDTKKSVITLNKIGM